LGDLFGELFFALVDGLLLVGVDLLGSFVTLDELSFEQL
jgi:hypothetical protein